ncbi:unnamed protein product [Linum tenue]|uniref:isoleucine--tRNA ligase n=1 Tax=Linum tenue TaxID=586396 RepID=A0AAV0LDZ4_9ROSI|nr:unnamed protein product [Linum tenue]
MALLQSYSSYKVLSHKNFGTATSERLLHLRRRSSRKFFSFLNTSQFSTYPTEEFTSSKRRSRGPVMAAKKASEGEKQEEGRYKHTVDLPKTTFGMRANSLVREPEIQKLWDENDVFRKVIDKNNGENFVLHDGPPYANGDLHMGHALNKILKDIINRYKDRVEVYMVNMGKVLQSLDHDARKDLTPSKLRTKAAKFAKATVKTQMASFKRYGVWADWDNPYLTLDPQYEAAQIEVFGKMALQGYIYRGRKPVYWSPSSRTALAEAELEYPEGHVSKSIYVTFKMVCNPTTSNGLLEEFFPDLCLAIWTTTPWTIPANAAVAVNDKLQYAIVQVQSFLEDSSPSLGKKKQRPGNLLKQKLPFLVVASDLVATLETKWGVKLLVRKTILGAELEGFSYTHPVDKRECPVVIGGDYITTESGTGLVHTAPGHGQEDYVTGIKYGLPMLSPVDDDGKFTEEAAQFSGLDVLGEGNTAVVKYLDERLSIIMEESYQHKYPYDWRTKKPTIYRATEQWFASVEGFRQAAMDAIRHVKWTPPQAENRISAMISSRSDWCISRQRTWGVPIPVFYHVKTKEPLMNEETIEHVKAIIAQKGSDAWWYMKVEDLLPDKYRDEASEYEKGTDTMDVWFDSGSSWAAVLGKRSLMFPADLYLEGTDQHRGWFQSSLLTSMATKGMAPYSSVITHGFVLDEKGYKMSKSLGNVVDPRAIIEGGKNSRDEPAYGADVLRLWVSSVDYSGDVMIGAQVLRQVSDMYRKLRGTLRYLLSNLHDWKADNVVSYHNLPMIDKHALFQLENVVKNVKLSYDHYQFFKIFQVIQRFVIVDLSNFYFDVAKDRLYVGGSTSFTRRSCQTVLAAHLLSIVKVIAPILPHLAEDVWQNLPFQYTNADGSTAKFVFESKWPDLNEEWLSLPDEEADFWAKILELRTEVNKVMETARTGKLIGSSLEAKVYLHTSDDSLASKLHKMSASGNDADALHRIFITSQAEVVSNVDKELAQTVSYTGEYLIQGNSRVWIGVSRAAGSKCERCWNYTPQVGSFTEHPTLCERCYNVIGVLPEPTLAAVK